MTKRQTVVLVVVIGLIAIAVAIVKRPNSEAGTSTTPAPSPTLSTATDAASATSSSDTVEVEADARQLDGNDRLRVSTVADARRLTDRAGRPILLRGASVNALVDYGTSHTAPVPLRAQDFDEMATLGFNVLRLAVSWSRVMPEPGQLDQAYLRQISTHVRRAGRRGLHTVISMHSDRYAADLGTDTEFDGAPRWAVATDGQACGDPRPRYYTPCAAAAARHFYRGDSVGGKTGLQWYTDAVSAVAAAGRRGGTGYTGIDILNEPTDPDATPDAAATTTWASQLHALQRGIVRRLRADGERAPVWIQPQGPRSTGTSVPAILPSLDDDQLVYAPHAYIDVYNGGPTLATAERMRTQYRAFEAEARTLRAAVVIGEFPGAVGPGWDELRDEHLMRQRRAGFGGIAWLWKQPADGYGWGTLAPDGSLRPDSSAAQRLSEPRLAAGTGAVRVEGDGAGTVVVRSSGAAQTADVWLGTTFDGGDSPMAYRLQPGPNGDAITVERAWAAPATLGSTQASGTLVRLRLPRGEASATLSPAG